MFTTITRTAARASVGVLAAALSIGLAAPASAATPAEPSTVLAATALAAPSTGFCKNPWVLRLARPADRVCVSDETRRDTELENKLALSRQVAYGNNTCISPFVWRDAVAGDQTCVPVDSRTRAFRDNAAAAERRASKCDEFALSNEGRKLVVRHFMADKGGAEPITTVTFPVADDGVTVESRGQASYRHHAGRATSYGTARGKITGRTISITVNWTEGPQAGWVGNYRGQLGDEGRARGTVTNAAGTATPWVGFGLHPCRPAPVK